MMRFDLSTAENKELMKMITTEESEDVNDEIDCQITLLAKKLKRANFFQVSTEVKIADDKVELRMRNPKRAEFFGNVTIEKNVSVHQLRLLSSIEFCVSYFQKVTKEKERLKLYLRKNIPVMHTF